MASRLVVIGGDAAGASAASVAKRTAGDALDVVMLERGHHVSYSACGIPYWLSGAVDGPDALVARTAAQHRANGIDVRLNTEATAIDVSRGCVETRQRDGSTARVGFDALVVATGAEPRRPKLPGIDASGVLGVQTLEDGERMLDRIEQRRPRTAVVVGGGYIGVEMAEACLQRGMAVTLVDQLPEPMTTLDGHVGARVRRAMEDMGIQVRTGVAVSGFETDSAGELTAVATAEGTFPADIAVLGLGVRPLTELAERAGLPIGAFGGVRTDDTMRVEGFDDVYAAGDCVESWDRVSRSWVYVPLGTHANKQGRVAGLNVAGRRTRFPGVVRTAVSKVCGLEIARTGLRETDAEALGLRVVSVTIDSTTRAGYFPGTQEITVTMVAERDTGRLLGAQILGGQGSAKRIDTCAMALWSQLTVGELAMTDLAYAPPFSSVWDPVQVAARAAEAALD